MAASIADLIDAWAPRLQRAFLAAIADIQDKAQIGVIAALLERGDVNGAVEAVGLDPVAFRALDATTAQAFEDGGTFTVARFPALRQPNGHRLTIRFDVRNPSAEDWLRDHSSRKVTEIVDDQRVMIRAALTAGMVAGRNPRDVALDLVGRINPATGRREGGTIGLTAHQEEWARRYADQLARLDPAALTRQLRDKRFDSTVRTAIEQGKALKADQIAKMVLAYRNRALRYRAETIGRTEAMAALHQSQHEATQQAINAGQINPMHVEEIWRTTLDGRERDTHRAMNGQRVRRGQPFVSPSGARLRYPGDPQAPAAEIVNCRCYVEVKVNFLAGVR
ncbi:phage minor head protein [Methylobacterium nodulans]|uniref:Putative head morphogenesis protein SPP1 gp7 n=1 Tax=Methylobacterium nodulans (strain LMG 21967 / CNCM I-2342 / ORS 2060) TaxID=460265 RepID=B8IIV6_METNO|nr:phage minor head protein [Methylobacterium nodulans]ACL61751.1 putative head morphogenesis protein SPP1 gp7 [Methylobacterium nodulans ORS 2060]